MSLQKIISGGQSGVDRAALDVALELGIPCGGWCPLGRKAEDGPIPDRYPLKESRSASYAIRTRWNVRDSDATLILTRTAPTGGTALTVACAKRLSKPILIQRLSGSFEHRVQHIQDWIAEHHIRVLNVAGPRESNSQGIAEQSRELLRCVLSP